MPTDLKSDGRIAQKVIVVETQVPDDHHEHEFHFLSLNMVEWAALFSIVLAIAGIAKIAHNWKRKNGK